LCRDLNALLGFQFRNPENDTAESPGRVTGIVAAFAANMASDVARPQVSITRLRLVRFTQVALLRDEKAGGKIGRLKKITWR